MGFFDKDLKDSLFQCLIIFFRESSIASFDKIMVEGGVGVLRRADGHNGEVKVFNWVGGDRGGDGILLPVLVGLADQDTSRDEPKAND